MKTITISKRISSTPGWVRVENKSHTLCDKCNALLWQGPDGSIYCDKDNCGEE